VIVQNVHVEDGADVPDGTFRDFTPMYLPMSTLADVYSQDNVGAIMQHRQTKAV
jgi:hypothetical protein